MVVNLFVKVVNFDASLVSDWKELLGFPSQGGLADPSKMLRCCPTPQLILPLSFLPSVAL